MKSDDAEPKSTECPYCGRTDRHTHRAPPPWRFYREGVIVDCDEATLREFSEQLGVHSDENGVASMVMAQMWAEIDRLRNELIKARGYA